MNPPTIVFKAHNSDHKANMPYNSVKHCAYIKGLLEAAPEGDVEIEIPHTDHVLINFMVGFLEQHADDEEMTPDWEKQKPRPLTEWDKENLTPITGIALVNLLKASNFIGCQLMLNVIASHVGGILSNKNEAEVQEYFGVTRVFSPEEEEQVKAKYPVPFY